MTREQILNTARELMVDCDSAIDFSHVIEYLDGAIGELVDDKYRDGYQDGLARIHEN